MDGIFGPFFVDILEEGRFIPLNIGSDDAFKSVVVVLVLDLITNFEQVRLDFHASWYSPVFDDLFNLEHLFINF